MSKKILNCMFCEKQLTAYDLDKKLSKEEIEHHVRTEFKCDNKNCNFEFQVQYYIDDLQMYTFNTKDFDISYVSRDKEFWIYDILTRKQMIRKHSMDINENLIGKFKNGLELIEKLTRIIKLKNFA
jgi:hypothetical protein